MSEKNIMPKEREELIRELLKDLESELPQPRFEEIKAELMSLLIQ